MDSRIGMSGSRSGFVVVRYTSSGALDVSFDGDGKAITDIGGVDTAWGLAIQPDGKIVAAGQRTTGGLPDDTIALVRYHDAVRLYVQQDANFNVTAVTDSAGVVLERYVYEPYGSFTVHNADWSADDDGQSDYGQLHLHQGGRYDAVSGTYHFRNRDYSPSLGRWVQQDPMGYVDGMSLYEYVRSGPATAADPSGLITVVTGNRDIRNAYAKASRSATGSRLFGEIDAMAACLDADVIINITASSQDQSNAPDNLVKLYWDMGSTGPVTRTPTRDTFIIEINPLASVLPTVATTPTANGVVSGTTLDQLIVHEAAHMWHHLFTRLGYHGYRHIWSGKVEYPEQYMGTTANDEYDAVSTENGYIEEVGGDLRIGHGLPPDQKTSIIELIDNLRTEQFVIGVHLLDWPVFPKDEFRRLNPSYSPPPPF